MQPIHSFVTEVEQAIATHEATKRMAVLRQITSRYTVAGYQANHSVASFRANVTSNLSRPQHTDNTDLESDHEEGKKERKPQSPNTFPYQFDNVY